MKRYLLLLFTALTLLSCNNDETNYHFESVPVLTAEVPDEFYHNEYNLITVAYELPASCYAYYYYDYQYEGASRIITPIAIVNDDITCEETPREGRFTFRILATQTEPYILNFWQGEDVDGEPIYLTIEVPVID